MYIYIYNYNLNYITYHILRAHEQEWLEYPHVSTYRRTAPQAGSVTAVGCQPIDWILSELFTNTLPDRSLPTGGDTNSLSTVGRCSSGSSGRSIRSRGK